MFFPWPLISRAEECCSFQSLDKCEEKIQREKNPSMMRKIAQKNNVFAFFIGNYSLTWRCQIEEFFWISMERIFPRINIHLAKSIVHMWFTQTIFDGSSMPHPSPLSSFPAVRNNKRKKEEKNSEPPQRRRQLNDENSQLSPDPRSRSRLVLLFPSISSYSSKNITAHFSLHYSLPFLPPDKHTAQWA